MQIRGWLVFLLIFSPLLRSFGLAPSGGTKNVLLLNSYHQGFMWTDSLTSGIMDALRKYPEINLYVKNLDAKKFDQAKFELERNYLREKYAGVVFSGVITTDNDALDFMFKYGEELFPKAPVVFTGVSNTDDYHLQRSRFYGFEETSGTDGVIEMVKRLLPKARRLLVVCDKTTTGRIYREEFSELQAIYPELKISFPEHVDADSICNLCGEKSDFDAVYYLSVSQDESGAIADNTLVFSRIIKTTKLPVFSNDPEFLGKGLVGGLFQRGKTVGNEAVCLLHSLMESIDYNSFSHVKIMPQEYFFDLQALELFNIPKSAIPEGALLINHERMINKTGYRILLVLFAIMLLAVIVLSVVNRRRRIAQRKAQVHLDKIEMQKNELEDASRKLSHAIEGLEDANKKLNESNENLMIAKMKAEESDKLKSAFLANVSHEIRTPLNSIVGFSSLLAEGVPDVETRATYTNLVESNTESLLVLIDEIIDLSKIEAGQLSVKKQEFSVDGLIDELAEIFTCSREDCKVELRVRKLPGNSRLVAFSDRVRVRQILINLLSNAFKFTEIGCIEFGYYQANSGEMVIYVKDTGMGISSEFHEAIFQRFRKLNENSAKIFRGTGLGLAITLKLTELLGGRIWLESELGKGATFSFTIEGLSLSEKV